MPVVLRIIIEHPIAQLLTQDAEPALDGCNIRGGCIKGLCCQHGLHLLLHLHGQLASCYDAAKISCEIGQASTAQLHMCMQRLPSAKAPYGFLQPGGRLRTEELLSVTDGACLRRRKVPALDYTRSSFSHEEIAPTPEKVASEQPTVEPALSRCHLDWLIADAIDSLQHPGCTLHAKSRFQGRSRVMGHLTSSSAAESLKLLSQLSTKVAQLLQLQVRHQPWHCPA